VIQFTSYDVALLDIEGTTTSIRFVYETLFPFARAHLTTFLTDNAHDPSVQQDLRSVRQQSIHDHQQGLGAPTLTEAGMPDFIPSAIANLKWQMDSDQKTTGLKSLQGKIWRDGYLDGSIKGHIYDDVPQALQRIVSAGRKNYIYSSGSIAAQKLLFGFSQSGDLLPLISGHFDTTTGPKKVADSYTAIAQALGCTPERILFGTDNPLEAVAARDAGMQVALFVRPGNHPLPPDHGFTIVHSMDEII
jgi:enolase-phosphatase E1